MSSLRILLAEDNPVNQKVVTKMLERIGYSTDIVDDGAKAVAAAHERNYDVILMDVMMPNLDGLEATRRIRAQESPDHRPYIIALTASAMGSDRTKCINSGMDDYISKPFTLERLRDGLRTAQEACVSVDRKIIDMTHFQAFVEMIGDDDPGFIRELLNDYLVDTERLRSELHGATMSNDAQSVRMTVHTLRSSSLVFGASTLVALCAKFEEQAAEGDLSEIRLRLPEFDGAIQSVHAVLVELAEAEYF